MKSARGPSRSWPGHVFATSCSPLSEDGEVWGLRARDADSTSSPQSLPRCFPRSTFLTHAKYCVAAYQCLAVNNFFLIHTCLLPVFLFPHKIHLVPSLKRSLHTLVTLPAQLWQSKGSPTALLRLELQNPSMSLAPAPLDQLLGPQ